MAKADAVVTDLAESEFPAWNRLVAESPTGSPYAMPEYLDTLCAAAGGRFRILGVHIGAELAGGVALYEERAAHGTFVSPRLLLYYNGPVLRAAHLKYPSEQTARHLKTLVAIEHSLQERGYGSVKLKARTMATDLRPFTSRGWGARVGYTYVVAIDDLDAAWGRVEQNLRRLVERCRRDGMVFTDDDDFDSFFRLHEQTMDRVAFRAYLPREAFRAFFRRLAKQGLCRLFHARRPDGFAVASQMVLMSGHPVTHTVSAAADADALKSGASAFLRWKSFERLAALGYRANDLTDASLNPVTHFKAQLGGALEPVIEIHRESWRFALGRHATTAVQMARGAAGSVVRRGTSVLRRPRS